MTLNFLERDYFRVGSVCLKINVKVEHDHEYPLSRKALKASRLLHPLSSLANGKANCKISSRRMTSCLFISKSEEKSSRWLVLWCVKSWTLGMTHEKTWKSCCRSVLPDYHYVFQLLYLIAFSCELSHLLDTRRTSTDLVSILLCVIYFILFFSATVLINGLATRMATGLLLWSFLVSLLSIPELWLIMVQFWVNMLKFSIFSSTLKFFSPRALSRITRWVKSSLISSG